MFVSPTKTSVTLKCRGYLNLHAQSYQVKAALSSVIVTQEYIIWDKQPGSSSSGGESVNVLVYTNLFFSQGHTLFYGCSRYTFSASQEKRSWVDFSMSRVHCKDNGSDLVSIESNEEWSFLNDTINKFQQIDGTEYFIGLTKDKDGRWRWISNNSTVNESYWAKGQPLKNNSNIRCAVMYKDFNKNYGLFDDLRCTYQRHGFICESEYHVMC